MVNPMRKNGFMRISIGVFQRKCDPHIMRVQYITIDFVNVPLQESINAESHLLLADEHFST